MNSRESLEPLSLVSMLFAVDHGPSVTREIFVDPTVFTTLLSCSVVRFPHSIRHELCRSFSSGLPGLSCCFALTTAVSSCVLSFARCFSCSEGAQSDYVSCHSAQCVSSAFDFI